MDINLLEKFMNGECSPEEAASVKSWLAEHPGALDEYIERTWYEGPASPMPAGMADAILQHVNPRPTASRRRLAPRWAAAAALLLLLAAAWYLLRPAATPAPAYTAMLITGGAPQRFELPDGSGLWLRENTRLGYDSLEFGRSGRTITLLEGVAFFDVRQNDQLPFVVVSGSVSTKVLGTSFSVQLGKTVAVTVATGKVGVSHDGRKLQTVNPGRRMVVNTENGDSRLETVPAWAAGGWKENTLQLTDASFADLQLALDQFYGVQLQSTSAKARGQVYNIRLEKTTAPEEVIQVLGMLNGISYTKKDAHTYIIH